MKKLILAIAFLYISINANAQYALIDARLSLLEERKEMHKELKNVSVDGKRFILIKDFEDRTERLYLSINANNATFAEVLMIKPPMKLRRMSSRVM
ncbi:MAG: hypothetical protein Q4C75_06970 [Bergeyella zoohelcum]|nr:hypothetical protein [Bergeyella zoohelcum]